MKECYVEGCSRSADRVWSEDRTRRICETHYKRWSKNGSFSIERPEGWGDESNRKYKAKECTHCKKVKKIAAKGLCRACYGREKRTGSLEYKRKGIINKCKINGCDNNVMSQGLCDKHRTNLARNGDPISSRPADWGARQNHQLYSYWHDTKRRETLNICSEWVDDFWLFVEHVGERPSKNHYLRALNLDNQLGPDNWAWIEGLTESNRKIKGREKSKNAERNRAKVSRDERASLLTKAKNKCQICSATSSDYDCSITGKKTTKKLAVDHCHKTGKLRGILCLSCNVALGHFKDDISLLERAIVYLSSTNNS